MSNVAKHPTGGPTFNFLQILDLCKMFHGPFGGLSPCFLVSMLGKEVHWQYKSKSPRFKWHEKLKQLHFTNRAKLFSNLPSFGFQQDQVT